MAPLSALTDEQLVVLVQATADPRAFDVLVARHRTALQAFLLRLSGSVHQAEDLTQDAFMKAYVAIGSFRADATFRTWLYSIAHREFLQARRKGGAIRRLLERVTHFGSTSTHDAPESLLDVQQGLLQLDARERAALLLADACGMSNTEVAQAMDEPLGTIKTCIRRARRKLGGALGDDYGED